MRNIFKSKMKNSITHRQGQRLAAIGGQRSQKYLAENKYRKYLSFLVLLFSLSACESEIPLADAYGNFEISPVLVGTEAQGRLLFFRVEEGQRVIEGELIGLVDTLVLHLKKEQLLASIKALGQKTQKAEPEVRVLQEQKQNLIREQKRVEALIKDNAATTKQLDDIKGQIQVVDQQMAAIKQKTSIANRAILSEKGPAYAQLRTIEDQIQRCYIYNPISGIVLNKLAEASEIKGFGSPLYRVANLDTLVLRAYIDGTQLGSMKIGEKVTVKVDGPNETLKDYRGEISWISEQAEFTPKVIQTKEERVNLVYAIKIRVPNDGSLKAGMPAEVWLSSPNIAEQ